MIRLEHVDERDKSKTDFTFPYFDHSLNPNVLQRSSCGAAGRFRKAASFKLAAPRHVDLRPLVLSGEYAAVAAY